MRYHDMKKQERIARAKRFKRLHRNGKGLTLEQIGSGETPPISRERVRQLIASLGG